MFRYKRPHLLIFDIVVLNYCFFLMHSLSGRREFTLPYFKLWVVINVIWWIVSVWNHKLERTTCKNWLACIRFIATNALYMLYITAVIAVLLGLTGFSGYHIIGTHVAYFLMLSLTVTIIFLVKKRDALGVDYESTSRPYAKNVVELFFIDLFLLIIAFSGVHYFKYGTIVPVDRAKEVFLILTAVWLVTSAFTVKFRQAYDRNIYYAASPFVKAYLISSAVMSVVVFAFRLFEYSRTLIFGTLLVLLILEMPIVFLRILRKEEYQEDDIETIDEVKNYIAQHELPVEEEDKPVVEPADKVLAGKYLKDKPQLFKYLKSLINLSQIDSSAVHVLDTHTLYNVETLENQSLRLFMNLHVINDFRFLNQYLLRVHSKLKNGGYFILRKERLENYREKLEAKFPNYVATFLYILHFLWHRVTPKLPGLNKVYFMVSKGRSRVVTRAELIGRLYFCGFKLIKFERIGDSHWFIAQKLATPIVEANPSYGPIIKLKRVGYQGKLIYVYKFRTMHPYAEYLQEYVYQTNNLDDSGKFKKDFRLTQWGKIVRKYWLDELPQLLNYIKGDLRLLGVRALSQHYYGLYPKDVQELRIQHKPGLVPPYYADMPTNFDEIIESERRYLMKKQEAPFKTDIIYFSKAVYNIIFKKAHSQ